MTHLFISYSRVDSEYAKKLVSYLQKKYMVWYDRRLHPGDSWWAEILKQIAAADVFVYLLSNESVASPYCQAEFWEARRLQKVVITVQVRQKPLECRD